MEATFGPITYDHVHGMMLNTQHALAMDAAAVLRAIRAAFSPVPDPLLVDAMSENGGVDTMTLVARAQIEAAADAAAERLRVSLGG